MEYMDWLPSLDNVDEACSIDKEIAIFTPKNINRDSMNKWLRTPHKFNFVVVLYHSAGSARFHLDMEEQVLDNPCNMVQIAPGQIIIVDEISEDFECTMMIMSIKFVEGLLVYMNGVLPFRNITERNRITHHTEREAEEHKHILSALKSVIAKSNNPYRLKVVEHIIMAIFYGAIIHKELISETPVPRSTADVLSKDFIELVRASFRTERQLKYYSDRLCITPRYLSRVLKETTGYSAAEWIERYVILEARALLKSTNLTIQQISDELNFPSQTFFGKYFKRRVGMSPKEYRRLG